MNKYLLSTRNCARHSIYIIPNKLSSTHRVLFLLIDEQTETERHLMTELLSEYRSFLTQNSMSIPYHYLTLLPVLISDYDCKDH